MAAAGCNLGLWQKTVKHQRVEGEWDDHQLAMYNVFPMVHGGESMGHCSDTILVLPGCATAAATAVGKVCRLTAGSVPVTRADVSAASLGHH